MLLEPFLHGLQTPVWQHGSSVRWYRTPRASASTATWAQAHLTVLSCLKSPEVRSCCYALLCLVTVRGATEVPPLPPFPPLPTPFPFALPPSLIPSIPTLHPPSPLLLTRGHCLPGAGSWLLGSWAQGLGNCPVFGSPGFWSQEDPRPRLENN